MKRPPVCTEPLVDWSACGQHRVWLTYVAGCENGVWYGDFQPCGEDPGRDPEMDWQRIAREQAEAEAAKPQVTPEEGPLDFSGAVSVYLDLSKSDIAAEIEAPTWLEYEVDGGGWAGALRVEDPNGDGALAWLLAEGIAPGQPFLVRFFGFNAWGPDHNGEYDSDYDYEILMVGPPPEDVAGEIERMWGLVERLAISLETSA